MRALGREFTLKPLRQWYIKMARWVATDIVFNITDSHTDHPIITVSVATPAGDLLVMAEPERRGQNADPARRYMHGERPARIRSAGRT